MKLKQKILTIGMMTDLVMKQMSLGKLNRISPVVLSLTGSEFENVNINSAVIIMDDYAGMEYLELRCKHPSLATGQSAAMEWKIRAEKLENAILAFVNTAPAGALKDNKKLPRGMMYANYKAYLKLCRFVN